MDDRLCQRERRAAKKRKRLWALAAALLLLLLVIGAAIAIIMQTGKLLHIPSTIGVISDRGLAVVFNILTRSVVAEKIWWEEEESTGSTFHQKCSQTFSRPLPKQNRMSELSAHP